MVGATTGFNDLLAKLQAAASAIEALNMDHSDSVSPAAKKDAGKIPPEELVLVDKPHSQTFPVHSDYLFGFTRSLWMIIS